MKSAKVFENGRSQAIRLPKEYRFTEEEVLINKIGDVRILLPYDRVWSGFMNSLELFSQDFTEDGRGQQPIQEREIL